MSINLQKGSKRHRFQKSNSCFQKSGADGLHAKRHKASSKSSQEADLTSLSYSTARGTEVTHSTYKSPTTEDNLQCSTRLPEMQGSQGKRKLRGF